MSFSLPVLPYALDALAPHISAETMSFHYEKHHRAYVDKLNSLLKPHHGAMTLEEIIQDPESEGPVFNNAAQIWHHSFYWKSMTPSYQPPSANFRSIVEKNFGSWEQFQSEFQAAALRQFGSGWVWLVLQENRLHIITTSNAGMPDHDLVPLLVCDVWEHAYYLDYQNRRDVYAQVFFTRLAHWSWAEACLNKPWIWR